MASYKLYIQNQARDEKVQKKISSMNSESLFSRSFSGDEIHHRLAFVIKMQETFHIDRENVNFRFSLLCNFFTVNSCELNISVQCEENPSINYFSCAAHDLWKSENWVRICINFRSCLYSTRNNTKKAEGKSISILTEWTFVPVHQPRQTLINVAMFTLLLAQ